MAEESLRTKFRKALQIALAAHFKDAGLDIGFVGWKVLGSQSERDIGCVWFDSKRPQTRDGNNEEAFFGVRVFRRFEQDQGADEARERLEARLEWTFETLEDGLRAVIKRIDLQNASGIDLAGWESYFNVMLMSKNHEQQYVEAAFTAWARNRTTIGG